MTAVAFGSCIHHGHDGIQPVWHEAASHKPDWLILAGDNIYMDYGVSLNRPRGWTPTRFANEMLERYSRQFLVKAFRDLVQSIPPGQVVGTWDDHDFGWNDCLGASAAHDMPTKRRIAHAMFHHYFRALNQRPLAPVLPPLPLDDLSNLPDSDLVVYRALDIGPLRVLLSDCRSYREGKSANPAAASLLGPTQEAWLLAEIAASSKPVLIVSGSVMTDEGDQSWDYFSAFFTQRFLPAVEDKLVMFLAGDVHENRLPPRQAGHPIEIVSSGAALGKIKAKRNFGILEISASEVRIFLYKRGDVQHAGRIKLTTGSFETSVSVLLAAAIPKPSLSRSKAQKRAALQKLSRGEQQAHAISG